MPLKATLFSLILLIMFALPSSAVACGYSDCYYDYCCQYFYEPVPSYSYGYTQYPGGYGATYLPAGPRIPTYSYNLIQYPGGTGAAYLPAGPGIPGYSYGVNQYGGNYGYNNYQNYNYYNYAPIPTYTTNYSTYSYNQNMNYHNPYSGGFVITSYR